MENYSLFIEFAYAQGVPIGTTTLILVLPIVVTIIAFFRQVVGIKAFGIYTPALVTFAFLWIGTEAGYETGAENFLKGLAYGVTIFVVVIGVGTLTRILMKKFRLLYLPRMAIVLTVVAFATLAVLIVSGFFQRTGLANTSIFPILIMIALVEKFVSTQIEKGVRTAVILSVETLIISLVCYFVVGWREMLFVVQKYPWVVLFTLPINFLLGKWTGLRISELIRFKDVIKNVESSGKK